MNENSQALIVLLRLRRWGWALFLIPALVVSVIVGASVRSTVIDGFAMVIADGIGGVAAAALEVSDIESPLSQQTYDELDRAITVRLQRGVLSGLRVVNVDGVTVYSTDDDEVGKRSGNCGLDDGALEGNMSVQLVNGHPMSTAEGELLKVCAPLVLPGSSVPVGAITVFKPYEPMRSSVWTPVIVVVLVIMLGAILAMIAQQAIVAQTISSMEHSQKQAEELNARIAHSMHELEEHALGTLQALAAAVDAKDAYTAQHALNVAEYALVVCECLPDCDKEILERAALLHDIGKIGVAESVLLKPSGLNSAEFKLVKDHSGIGANIIEAVPFLREVVPIVRYHHERWDGTGYPDGLSGTDIPWMARVLAVADAFDAMTSNRPYRKSMTVDDARQEIMRGRGSQFDPEVADAFVRAIDLGHITLRRNV